MKPLKILRSGLRLLCLVMLAFSAFSLFAGNPDPVGVTTAMAFGFADLTWGDGIENMGGFTSVAYLGFIPEIATFPTRNAAPTTPTEAITLTGAFVMKPEKKFIEVYVTPGTFDASAENQGETDAKSFHIKGELFYPGTQADCLAFCRMINNNRAVLIGTNPNTGERYCWGEQHLPVTFKPKVTWGKGPADRRGATIEWECDSFSPAWIYSGALPLSPAPAGG